MCPGCGEPLAVRQFLETIEDLDVAQRSIAVAGIGCYTSFSGSMDIDLYNEPLGEDADGNPVYLTDIWPSPQEIEEVIDARAQFASETLVPALQANALYEGKYPLVSALSRPVIVSYAANSPEWAAPRPMRCPTRTTSPGAPSSRTRPGSNSTITVEPRWNIPISSPAAIARGCAYFCVQPCRPDGPERCVRTPSS